MQEACTPSGSGNPTTTRWRFSGGTRCLSEIASHGMREGKLPMKTATATSTAETQVVQELGVHSEVGKLRTVMVCRPGLAHQRLTPGNCRDLLFDDVMWVQEAQKDHYDFVLKIQERGTEVLELHDLLTETLNNDEARRFIHDRRVT